MSPSLSLSYRQDLRLSLAQRQAVLLQQAQVRQELVESLRGREERMKPEGICPDCLHRLNLIEIMRGFLDNPLDTTTACPKCNRRFQPTLEMRDALSRTSVSFWCPTQTLEELRGKESCEPEALRRDHAAAYYSAVVHFGSLTSAFSKIGSEYPHGDEMIERDKRIVPFLGLLPDTVIAEIARMSTTVVRKKRRDLGIERYRRSQNI